MAIWKRKEPRKIIQSFSPLNDEHILKTHHHHHQQQQQQQRSLKRRPQLARSVTAQTKCLLCVHVNKGPLLRWSSEASNLVKERICAQKDSRLVSWRDKTPIGSKPRWFRWRRHDKASEIFQRPQTNLSRLHSSKHGTRHKTKIFTSDYVWLCVLMCVCVRMRARACVLGNSKPHLMVRGKKKSQLVPHWKWKTHCCCSDKYLCVFNV